MRDNADNRSPEEIANDVERTRAEMSSTIDAIQHKLTPGQMMDQALQYTRHSLPADFGANLGNTVRDNPMPVALIGVGVAWLMMQGRQSDGQARARRRASYDRDLYDSEAGLDYEGVYGTDASDRSSGEGKMQQAKAKLSDAGNRVSETGHRLMDKASEMSNRARNAVSGARERVSSSAGSGRARMNEFSQRSQQQYQRARDGFGHVIEDQPLVLGAIGLAVGAVLGAMMPATRREDEMMGSTRDDLLEKAKETGREQAQTLKESAQHVADTAKQEAQRVGKEASEGRSGNGQSSATTATSGAGSTSGSSTGGTQSLH